MEISVLLEVKSELKRFEKRLNAALDRLNDDKKNGYYSSGSYVNGAVKRAALDLKNELTRITK